MRASTKNPFDGYVFIMDHFHKKECRAGPEEFPDARSIGITIPFTDCNIHRYRSVSKFSSQFYDDIKFNRCYFYTFFQK